jgi:hypothetical protein
MPRIRVPALLIPLGCLAPLIPAQEELSKKRERVVLEYANFETKNYSVDYEKAIPVSTVKTLAQELDDILEQYVRLFGERPKAKLKVKFLDSLNTYEQEGGDPSHPGHYHPRSRCLVIRQMAFNDLIPTVYHEAFHQYLAMYTGFEVSIPVWFNEGTASYFEQMQREKGTKKLSPKLIDKRKLRMVKDAIATRSDIPLEKLIDADHQQFHDKDKEGLYYTQSFAVIYFLMQSNAGKQVTSFMKELKAGNGIEAANAKIFGADRKNLKKIEKAFKEYTAGLSLEMAGR